VSGTVFLTGATGFLGRQVLVALQSAGWSVLCGARLPSKLEPQTEVVQLDLADPAAILALARRHRADAVVHLASDVALDAATDDARLFVPNVLATGCIAWLAREWGARMLFTSSVLVHGARCAHFAPDVMVAPDTPYGRSKLLGEELLARSGIEHVVLRIAGIFGDNGPTHLGINRAIGEALRGRPPVLAGDGAARRNYVYVKDVAAAIVFALERRLTGTHYVAGSDALSVREMLRAICDTLLPGAQPSPKDGPPAADQLTQASAELPTARSFRDALADIRQAPRACG
jgi:UDP-glucose 4-epimerase